jgi:hypothetical protein
VSIDELLAKEAIEIVLGQIGNRKARTVATKNLFRRAFKKRHASSRQTCAVPHANDRISTSMADQCELAPCFQNKVF